MRSAAPNIWNGLKNDFSDLAENELKAALCRATHYQTKDVSTLRPAEARIKDWLDAKGVNPAWSINGLRAKRRPRMQRDTRKSALRTSGDGSSR